MFIHSTLNSLSPRFVSILLSPSRSFSLFRPFSRSRSLIRPQTTSATLYAPESARLDLIRLIGTIAHSSRPLLPIAVQWQSARWYCNSGLLGLDVGELRHHLLQVRRDITTHCTGLRLSWREGRPSSFVDFEAIRSIWLPSVHLSAV